ncbi:unnamed protein product, partial [Prorocentrum cordatum]
VPFFALARGAAPAGACRCMPPFPGARRLQGSGARDADIGSSLLSPPKPRSRVQGEVRFSEAHGNGGASPSSKAALPCVSSRQQHCVQDREGSVRGYHVGFDARASGVHFAQHRRRRSSPPRGQGTSTWEPAGDSATSSSVSDRWHESRVAASMRAFLRSRVWQTASMGALFVALFFADVFVWSRRMSSWTPS